MNYRNLSLAGCFALVLACGIASCGGDGGGGEADSTPAVHNTGEAFVGDPLAIVANVGDEAVTLAEVNLVVDFWVESNRGQMTESRAVLQDRALTQMVDQMLLAQEALRRQIVIDSTKVDQMIESWKTRSGGEQWEQKLALSNVSIAMVRRSFRRDLLVQELVSISIRDTVQLAVGATLEYYNAHPEYFSQPKVTASHILIKLDPAADETAVAAAQEKIDAILAEVKGGADFAEVATAKSEGPSAPRGGDLGTFGPGQMVPAFNDVVFALGVGEISDVVKTQFGFHVIKLYDRSDKTPLADVEPQIQNYLIGQQVQLAVNDYAQSLRADTDVKIHVK
jgi:peptidyl-prolyl cis-trans isomerase C